MNFNSFIFIVLFGVLLFINQQAAAHDEGIVYTCEHDRLNITLDQLPTTTVKMANPSPKPMNQSARTAELLEDSSKRKLQFKVIASLDIICTRVGEVITYSGTQITCGEDDVLTADKNDTLWATFDSAAAFLSAGLWSEPTASITVPVNACTSVNNVAMEVTDADFVVIVSAVPSTTSGASTLAWGTPCARTGTTPNRPIIGMINFIPSALPSSATELQKRVAAHEISHALGFLSLYSTAQNYYDLDGTYKSGGTQEVYRSGLQQTVRLVSTPRVLAAARAHFGCDTLDGVEIEDSGGSGTAGAHWKGRIFYEEALVGVISSAILFYSSVTLAYFEDLGFYTANYGVAEDNYLFGYKKGCDFLYQTCKSNTDNGIADEYCFVEDSSSKQRCSYDRFAVGRCDVKTYSSIDSQFQYFSTATLGGLPTMDYCPVISSYSNANCLVSSEVLMNFNGHEYGLTSRCFESTLVTSGYPNLGKGPRCILTTCTPEGQVLLRIQGQTVECPADGSEGKANTTLLYGIHGTIQCPNATVVCLGRNASGVSDMATAVSTPTRHPCETRLLGAAQVRVLRGPIDRLQGQEPVELVPPVWHVRSGGGELPRPGLLELFPIACARHAGS
ncbi:leishmanolysin [Strigomonas culicis]|uniref:Leishmanolysin-like peptidase n=1 Tax=Strigomonas culicis TaxID=28005 RepID=S9U409_9TRYP|nr:leishmanolysin [Strigomonas culicis]|eukprot:EPY23648.1 leishmanolysin [Strigomonas culicis]